MDITKLPETLTRPEVEALRNAFGHFYDQEEKTRFVDPTTNLSFDNVESFVDYLYSPSVGIPKGTSAKHIGITLENWYETLTKSPEYQEPTIAGAPEYPVSATTPTKLAREEQEEIRAQREEALRQTAEESKEAVSAAVKRQQEIYLEQIEKTKAAEKTLKEKEVYVKKQVPTAPEENQRVIDTIKTQAQADPVKTIDAVTAEMRNRLTDKSIPDEAIRVAAVYTVANIISDGKPAMQEAVTTFVAKNAIKIGNAEIVDPAKALSDQQKSIKDLALTLNESAFGQTFTEAAIPTWTVSETSLPDYTGTSIGFIPPVAKVLIEKQAEVIQKSSTTLQIETRDFVQRWQDEITRGNVQGGAFNVVVVQESLRTLPQGSSVTWSGMNGPSLLGGVSGMTTPINIAGGFIKQKVVGKAATAVVTKLGLKATLTAIGSAVPGLGTAAGWVASEVLSRINWKNVKRFSAYIIGGLTALVLLPFIGLGSALGLGAAVGLGSMAFGAGAGGLTIGAIGSGILGFFGAIAGATLGAIGIPILVTLLGFPVAVAVILFIINSGAYVVPPSISLLTGAAQNPYIEITKVANPTGPFDNSDLPLKITYTITVTAKKESLTNVTIKHTCSATTKTGNKSCPAPNITVPNGTIDVGSPFTFSYDANYDTSYKDAFIVNTASVTANAQGQSKSQQVAASASIKVGNPPDVCPNGWPVSGHWMITQTPGGGYSHRGIEAMDIATSMGTAIMSTSTGIATVVYTSGPYAPVYVDVASNCGGKPIRVRYAHFSAVFVKSGDAVTFGEVLGRSGTEGTGPHLHYEFYGITMGPPYIPKSIPRGCSDDYGKCGYVP